jgi:ADP-heptose:LPS heptosyltransferase
LPIASSELQEIGLNTLVIAPGSKTGEMSAKRWPYYSELANEFDDVAVVGTADDLQRYDNTPLWFGPHVKTFVDRLTLRETAELLVAAGAVVANDTGLAYISAAVGTPTLIRGTAVRLPPRFSMGWTASASSLFSPCLRSQKR